MGFKTRRVPFHKDGKAYFALISGGMMDLAKYMRDRLDVNYLGRLAAPGYRPGAPAARRKEAP